jgi:diguanylate cyclase (GGDEF)-like protein/PAS domain S-box-containing protein
MVSETTQPRDPLASLDKQVDGAMAREPSLEFLKFSITTLAVGAIVAVVALRIVAPDQMMRSLAPLLVSLIALTGWYFLSKGKIRTAQNILAFGAWVAATGTAVFTNGVRAPVVVAYPMIILCAAWLISLRAALALAGLTITATFGLVVAESWDLLPTSLPSSAVMYAGDQCVVYIVSALLALFLVRIHQSRVAEQQKAQRALRERTFELDSSQAELNRAQAVAQVGSWAHDLGTGLVRLSAEACRIAVLPEGANHSYRTCLARIHPDDRAHVNRIWKSAVRGQRFEFDIEYRILVDGAIRWIHQRAVMVPAVHGTPLRAVGTLHDVTDRRLAEHAIRVRDERFKLLFDRASDGIIILSTTGTIIAANESFARMHGYAPQEMLNLRLKDLDTPAELPSLPERIQRILAGETLTFEVEHFHKDGHVVPLEVSSSLIVSDGEPLMQAFHRDISERRRAEQAQRIAATAFESQQGMAITDAKRVILRVNKAFTEITGYSAKDAVGQTPRLLSSGHHDAAFFTAIRESLRLKGAWQGEIWNRRKWGDVYPEWLTISAVRDDAGQITHFVDSFSDISERKIAEDKINNLAFYDPLTSLPNRRLLMDRLDQLMTTSARRQEENALLFVDLDNFKALNDTLGHACGDALLTQVAQRLLSCLGDRAMVARVGSDEFVVVLDELGRNELEAATHSKSVGEKILATLSQDYQLDHGAHHSSACIGITLFGGSQQERSDEPLRRAELAMYQAKASGRNSMRFFDPQMQVDVTNRVAHETALREAVLFQQFVLFYQPQVVGAGRVTGVEALLRWQHPQRGLVSPAEIISLAEETGLILPIGQWVLETACAQLALWARRPEMAHLSIAVNVSARQFHQKDFVASVMMAIERSGANPKRLKLELTESMLVQDVEGIITKMSSLKMNGVSFSLDDFGTGYSSLSYLKRLPLDQLKIDQGFVRNILTDPNDAAIAKMVIALADSLGLSVIAEGVEIEAQRDFLAGLGCHAYQGYWFSRPVPIDAFEAYLQRVDDSTEEIRAG